MRLYKEGGRDEKGRHPPPIPVGHPIGEVSGGQVSPRGKGQSRHAPPACCRDVGSGALASASAAACRGRWSIVVGPPALVPLPMFLAVVTVAAPALIVVFL